MQFPKKVLFANDLIGNSAIVTERDGVVVVVRKVATPSGGSHTDSREGTSSDVVTRFQVPQVFSNCATVRFGKLTDWVK